MPEAPSSETNSMEAWAYYRGLFRGQGRALAAAVLLSVLQAALVLPIAFLVRKVFDGAIPTRELRGIIGFGVLVLLLYLLEGMLALWTRHTVLSSTKKAIAALREDLLRTSYEVSMATHDRIDRESWHGVIVQDTERLDIMSNALVAVLLPATVLGACLTLVACYLSWRLFLALLALAPFYFLVNRLLGARVRSKVQAFRSSFERFSGGIHFVLRHMPLTRSHGAEAGEKERLAAIFDELRRTSGSMAWLQTAYASTQGLVVTTAGVLLMILGGVFVVRGVMSLGELLSFFVAISLLKTQLRNVSGALPQIMAGEASLRSLHGLIRHADRRPYEGTTRIPWTGKLSLRALSFSYGEGPLLLQDLNLSLLPGETVALKGDNGAGKSSLVSLILGFHRPSQGALLADEHPYDELDLSALRKDMGVLPQEPLFFRGTVRENLAYGREALPDEELFRAARLALAHDMILALPLGYDTPVGEEGILLSGGQRQRIAIARALLGRPKLLILDEPANHLPSELFDEILRKLQGEGMAILLISHEESVLDRAHRSFLLHQAHLSEQEKS